MSGDVMELQPIIGSSVNSYQATVDPSEIENSTIGGGCMVCREEVLLVSFGNLQPGDHIATRGQACCLGLLYDHHAIVIDTEINHADGTTDITVIDVDEKPMTCSLSHCLHTGCCCGWLCSCVKCEYPIRKHRLYNKPWMIPPGFITWLLAMCFSSVDGVMIQQIKKLEYRKRRNPPSETVQIAETFVNDSNANNLEYCLLNQNCEHFVNACVSGPERMTFDQLKDSMSLQAKNCCWRLVHLAVFLLQGVFYGINFCVYAVFVAKDDRFDIFAKPLRDWLERLCYHPNNCLRGFDTRCDWLMVVFFTVMFIIAFWIALFIFYQPLYRKGYICTHCLIIARIDCFSKLFTFILIEAMSIYLENPTYKRVVAWHTHRWALVILGISVLGAFIVYSVSSVLTWVLGMCGSPTCYDGVEFTKYFHFRGAVWLFHWLWRRLRHVLRLFRLQKKSKPR